MSDYRFEISTGRWIHRHGLIELQVRLSQLAYNSDGDLPYPNQGAHAPESALADYLEQARAIVANASDTRAAIAIEVDLGAWSGTRRL